MARLETGQAEPDEVESMPRNNPAGKPNFRSGSNRRNLQPGAVLVLVTVPWAADVAGPGHLPAEYRQPPLKERHRRQSSCSSADPGCFAILVPNHNARFCRTHRRIGSVRLAC